MILATSRCIAEDAKGIIVSSEVRENYGGAADQPSMILRINNHSGKTLKLAVDDPRSKESYWSYVPLPVQGKNQKSALWAFLTDLKTGDVKKFKVLGKKSTITKNEMHSLLGKNQWGWEIPFSDFGSPPLNDYTSIHFIYRQHGSKDTFFSTSPTRLTLIKKSNKAE